MDRPPPLDRGVVECWIALAKLPSDPDTDMHVEMKISAVRKIGHEPIFSAGADIVVAGQAHAATTLQPAHNGTEGRVVPLVHNHIEVVPACKRVLQGCEVLDYAVLEPGPIEGLKQHGGNWQGRYRFKVAGCGATVLLKHPCIDLAVQNVVLPESLAPPAMRPGWR